MGNQMGDEFELQQDQIMINIDDEEETNANHC
jgi:hypothetical protein